MLATIIDQPIDGFYLVDPDGQVALGPSYGRVKIDGLTWQEAEKRITQHLKMILLKPTVQVALARRGPPGQTTALPKSPFTIAVWDVLSVSAVGMKPGQPIDVPCVVEPDGRIALGPAYGRVAVGGLTCEQAEWKIAEYLKKIATESDTDLELANAAAALARREYQQAVDANKVVPNTVPATDVQKRFQRRTMRQLDVVKAMDRVKPMAQVTLARKGEAWREAVLPKLPYKIGVWDVLNVRVLVLCSISPSTTISWSNRREPWLWALRTGAWK